MKKILIHFIWIIPTILAIYYAGAFCACIVDQSLLDHKIRIRTKPSDIIFYLQGSRQAFFFSLMFFVLFAFAIYFLCFSQIKAYKSDLVEITPDIRTPIPAGQGQHGTARWLQKKEFDKIFDYVIIDKKKLLNQELAINRAGLVIGKKDLPGKEKLYIVSKDRHSLNIGATRSGKTRNIVLQTIIALLLAKENIFCVDMKGEIYDYTAKKAKQLGYNTILIDFIEPYQSDRFNYLQSILKQLHAGNLSKAIEETWTLVSQLVGEPPKNGEKLWNNGEASILAASIMAVCYDNMEHPEYQNLTNVFYFITEMCQDYKGALPLEFYINSLPKDHPSRILLSATKLAAFRTRSSFYVSAVMTLRLLTMPSINQMTNVSDFDLETLMKRDQKTIIYLCLPARDNTYFPLASLTLRQITDEIDRIADEYGGRVPRRWNFMEDEFGNFTKITNIINQLSFGTGKGIRHNLFVQSFAQLEEKYDKDIAQIIKDNCDVTIYLQSPNQSTREEISKKLGTYTVTSYSISNNVQAGTLSSRGSRGESVNLVKRELLTAEEVGRIKRPYSLVMTDEHPAIMYAPDLSKYFFNKFLGLGSKKHNQKLRMILREERKKKERAQDAKIDTWDVWEKWKRYIDILIAQQERKKQNNNQGE